MTIFIAIVSFAFDIRIISLPVLVHSYEHKCNQRRCQHACAFDWSIHVLESAIFDDQKCSLSHHQFMPVGIYIWPVTALNDIIGKQLRICLDRTCSICKLIHSVSKTRFRYASADTSKADTFNGFYVLNIMQLFGISAITTATTSSTACTVAVVNLSPCYDIW